MNTLAEQTCTALRQLPFAIRGIVHVGAHSAQEAEGYATLTNHVLWIEPNPIYAAQLRQKDLTVIECAVGLQTGQQPFYLTRFDQASSLLQPLLHEVVGCIDVKVKPLKDLIDSSYNVLAVDVQGAELDVLKSADLTVFEAILIELCTVERYTGMALETEVLTYLKNEGFKVHSKLNHAEPCLADWLLVR